MKNLLFILILSSFTAPVWAENYFDKDLKCVLMADAKLIEADFPQFRGLSELKQEKLCVDVDLHSDTFAILKSILALKSFNLESVQASKTQDDFGLKVIKEKNWWKYFTDRVKYFQVRPEYCQKDAQVVAYVQFSKRNLINLCPLFFESDVINQVSTLMHEVRHFDGHSHVTCTQGSQKGVEGACDESIKDTGSYAISTQVYVELAKSQQIVQSDRILAEMMAVAMVNHKFNNRPNVKTSEYVYLANANGELHRGVVNNLSKLERVGKLSTPGKVYSNTDTLTLLPLDSSLSMTRFSRDLKTKSPSVGLFGDIFNQENQDEKSLYSDFNYYGIAGFIKDSIYYNACGMTNTTITAKPLKGVRFKSMMSLKNNVDLNSDEVDTYLLSEEGATYLVKCKEGNVDEVIFTRSNLGFPKDTVNAFSTTSGNALLLNENGEILNYNLVTKKSAPTSILQRDWISITPHKIYDLFSETVK